MLLHRYSKQLSAVLIFMGGLLLFNVGLCHQEIIGFESRFYLFAQEMLRHGPTWFPTIYGVAFTDYPGTTTFFIYLFAKLIGHLDKWVAVFPSSVCAALTLVTTFLVGELYHKKLGWFAVAFLLLTNTFFVEARTISPDQYITLAATVCFYLIYSAQQVKNNFRLVFIPLLLLFGFACRGPIGLVVPAGVVCAFYLADGNSKGFLVAATGSLLLLLASCGILFAIAFHVGGWLLMHNVLQMQIAGRLHHSQVNWYFYFVESFAAYALTYPLVVLMLPGLLHKQNKNKFLLQLIAWVLVIMLGMSIPAGKKVRYVMAMSPALALLAGYLFALLQRQKYLRILKKSFYWLLFFFPWISLCVVLMADVYLPVHHVKVNTTFAIMVLMLFGLQWINYFLRRKELFIVGSAAFVFAVLVIGLQEPINLALNKTRDFVQQVETARVKERAKLVFYRESPDALPLKYIINMDHEEKPFFIDSVHSFNAIVTPAYFVTEANEFANLPKVILERSAVVFTGVIGHDPVVVFKKN